MRNNCGWVKLYRSILDNPVVMKSTAHFAIWCLLMLMASNKPQKALFRGESIELKPGQLVTGRKELNNRFCDLNESKVERILKDLENEQQIEQQKSNKGRLITLLNWNKYQKVNSKMNNNRTTSEQQPNNNRTLNKNIKNIENIERTKEDNSFEQSFDDSFLVSDDDSDQLKAMGGSLGRGVVMLSDKQDEYLMDNLSFDEYNKYISIVADQELKGNSYKKKTHFQAILEMVNHDRRVAGNKTVLRG